MIILYRSFIKLGVELFLFLAICKTFASMPTYVYILSRDACVERGMLKSNHDICMGLRISIMLWTISLRKGKDQIINQRSVEAVFIYFFASRALASYMTIEIKGDEVCTHNGQVL